MKGRRARAKETGDTHKRRERGRCADHRGKCKPDSYGMSLYVHIVIVCHCCLDVSTHEETPRSRVSHAEQNWPFPHQNNTNHTPITSAYKQQRHTRQQPIDFLHATWSNNNNARIRDFVWDTLTPQNRPSCVSEDEDAAPLPCDCCDCSIMRTSTWWHQTSQK